MGSVLSQDGINSTTEWPFRAIIRFWYQLQFRSYWEKLLQPLRKPGRQLNTMHLIVLHTNCTKVIFNFSLPLDSPIYHIWSRGKNFVNDVFKPLNVEIKLLHFVPLNLAILVCPLAMSIWHRLWRLFHVQAFLMIVHILKEYFCGFIKCRAYIKVAFKASSIAHARTEPVVAMKTWRLTKKMF